MTPDNSKNFAIPIILKEEDGLQRNNEPIRIGVPIARSIVTKTVQLTLTDHTDKPHPSQIQVLEKWPDGSLKWILLDFFADTAPNSTTIFHIKRSSRYQDAFNQLVVEETTDSITIATGKARFTISRKETDPPTTIALPEGQSPVPISFSLTGVDDQKLAFVVEDCHVEGSGSLRCSIKKTGHFVTIKGKHFLNATFTYHFYSGCSFTAIDVVIHNPNAALHPGGLWDLGDPGSIFFKDFSVFAHLPTAPQNLLWQLSNKKKSQAAACRNWQLYQDSSGGKHWNSPNHVDYKNNLTVTFPGFHLTFNKDGEQKRQEGKRAIPYLQASNDKLVITGAISDFWQNFPKAIRLKEDIFSLGLFPTESTSPFELQGGEQKRHTVFFQIDTVNDQQAILQLLSPLNVYIAPEWTAQTNTISCLVPDEDTPSPYQQYINAIIEGPNSFDHKREQIDEYGWRNYGDTYADHEAVNHTDDSPFISHYNNQYDFIYGAFVHYLRTGNKRWRDLATPAARHMIDIDLYHTKQDRAVYNHGLFWHSDHYLQAQTASHRAYSIKNRHNSSYGGGTSNEHIYSSGLTLYYFLTGDTLAKDAVLELADYVIDMDDGEKSIFALFDDAPTGLASQTVDISYHKPGRGPGNCINCLIDAYRLSLNRRYLNKAEELIQRCIHPRDEIKSLQLDEPECRWSYLAFLQILGKYLDYKAELGETDYHFFFARDSLLHYAEWMYDNEVPYKDILHKVLIPTETWPAQDIRKCHVLHLAAKYGPETKRHAYSQKAAYFYTRCLEDLLSFKTAYLTRPLVTLCVYGYIHDYFLKHGYNLSYSSHCYNFGNPQTFIPQRVRAKKHFIEKLKQTIRLTKIMVSDKFRSKFIR